LALPGLLFFYSPSVVTLENSRLFAQLSPDELKTLHQLAREQEFSPGQEIFRERSPGDALYVLKDGMVEICISVGGSRQVLSEIAPGDFFGEMAVLEDKGRSASAVAKVASTVYMLPSAGILQLVERSPALALALLREISNRLREFNEQYLREMLQAERLAIIGRFARSIVHDLKNPLNIIGLTAEIVGMSQMPDEGRQEAVTTIRSQIDRISELVGDIIEFTQGTPVAHVLPASNYAEFVNLLLHELKADAALKNVTLELVTPPPSLPVVIHPKRLRRLFHNLTQNATEAMTDGGKLLLRFEVKPDEIVTEFQDTGPGIPAEITGRLFQAFVTHGKSHGTGLGLSICKRIVEDHRGWITARNRPGGGAIFAFGLPRAPEAA
jgi:signal transduction histidine kinase